MKSLLCALVLILAVDANARSWREGQYSRVMHPMAVAIQDPQKWREVWREHDASDPAPEVDFTRQSVVAVFLGLTRTAGVTVAIVVQQDPLDSNRINVFYRRTAIKNALSAQVESEPYAMVVVPRAGTIHIEEDEPASVPEPAGPPAAPKRDDTKFRAFIEGLSYPFTFGRL